MTPLLHLAAWSIRTSLLLVLAIALAVCSEALVAESSGSSDERRFEDAGAEVCVALIQSESRPRGLTAEVVLHPPGSGAAVEAPPLIFRGSVRAEIVSVLALRTTALPGRAPPA